MCTLCIEIAKGKMKYVEIDRAATEMMSFATSEEEAIHLMDVVRKARMDRHTELLKERGFDYLNDKYNSPDKL